jgi:hypothetical protein
LGLRGCGDWGRDGDGYRWNGYRFHCHFESSLYALPSWVTTQSDKYSANTGLRTRVHARWVDCAVRVRGIVRPLSPMGFVVRQTGRRRLEKARRANTRRPKSGAVKLKFVDSSGRLEVDGICEGRSQYPIQLRIEAMEMSDVITAMRQVIQDLVAPDLKSHTVKLEALQKQSEIQHDAVMKTLDAFRAEMRSEFAALRANNQVEVFRQVSPISERIAVVESRTK